MLTQSSKKKSINVTEELLRAILFSVCLVPARALLRLSLWTHPFRNVVWLVHQQTKIFQVKESLRVYGSGGILMSDVKKDAVGIWSQPQKAVEPDSSAAAITALDLQNLGAVRWRSQGLYFWMTTKAASESSSGPSAPRRLLKHLPIYQGWQPPHKLLFPRLSPIEKHCWWFWQQ